MRYQRSYGYVFSHPDWAVNLLAGSACILLPVVGWALFIGYLVEVFDHLRQHSDEQYPTFDIDRIGHYLARGVLPTVAHMIALMPVLVLLAIAVGALTLTGAPNAGPSPTGKVLASGASVLIVAVALVSSVVAAPVAMYLALGDSTGGGMGRFIGDFFKHVLHEAVMAQIFVVVIGLATGAFGLMLCGIGAPPALALAGFAQYHIFAQLHTLHQQRRAAPEATPAPQPAASNA